MATSSMPAEQQMTAQEREMLEYLENLQATNPAEYELLVKEMQQKAAEKKGKGGAAASQGEMVTPTPGFVAKTRSATNGGAKVFINVCQSEHVDKPAPVEASQESEEIQMRIPMSLGPPREDLDKGGDVCRVYDVVFHPDAVTGALAEDEFRSFMMQLIVYQVQQKHKEELSIEMTFPKVRGNYKGIAPLPQYMRKKGVPPPPPPGSKEAQQLAREQAAAEADAAKAVGGKGPLVEEVAAPVPAVLPSPSYAVEPRRLTGASDATAATTSLDASGGGGGATAATGMSLVVSPGAGAAADGLSLKADGLSLKAHLPKVEDAEMIELSCHAEGLELHVASLYNLSLELPVAVALPPLAVRFERQRRVLSVLWRVLPRGGLSGGVGGSAEELAAAAPGGGGTAPEAGGASAEGGAAGEIEGTAVGADGFLGGWQARQEREKEARLNARRRRLAGNKQLKRQAEAEVAEPVPVEEEAAAEVAAAEAAAAEAAAMVPKGPSPPPPLMGLSNSIMFELEEL